MAPVVRLLNGDGRKWIPELLKDVKQGSKEAQSTMVIFDGEKRFAAYKTFNSIRDKVALAIFDDVNVGQYSNSNTDANTNIT